MPKKSHFFANTPYAEAIDDFQMPSLLLCNIMIALRRYRNYRYSATFCPLFYARFQTFLRDRFVRWCDSWKTERGDEKITLIHGFIFRIAWRDVVSFFVTHLHSGLKSFFYLIFIARSILIKILPHFSLLSVADLREQTNKTSLRLDLSSIKNERKGRKRPSFSIKR